MDLGYIEFTEYLSTLISYKLKSKDLKLFKMFSTNKNVTCTSVKDSLTIIMLHYP